MKNLISWATAIGGILLLALFAVFVWTFKWWLLSAAIVISVGAVAYEKVTGKTPRFLQ